MYRSELEYAWLSRPQHSQVPAFLTGNEVGFVTSFLNLAAYRMRKELESDYAAFGCLSPENPCYWTWSSGERGEVPDCSRAAGCGHWNAVLVRPPTRQSNSRPSDPVLLQRGGLQRSLLTHVALHSNSGAWQTLGSSWTRARPSQKRKPLSCRRPRRSSTSRIFTAPPLRTWVRPAVDLKAWCTAGWMPPKKFLIF